MGQTLCVRYRNTLTYGHRPCPWSPRKPTILRRSPRAHCPQGTSQETLTIFPMFRLSRLIIFPPGRLAAAPQRSHPQVETVQRQHNTHPVTRGRWPAGETHNAPVGKYPREDPTPVALRTFLTGGFDVHCYAPDGLGSDFLALRGRFTWHSQVHFTCSRCSIAAMPGVVPPEQK